MLSVGATEPYVRSLAERTDIILNAVIFTIPVFGYRVGAPLAGGIAQVCDGIVVKLPW